MLATQTPADQEGEEHAGPGRRRAAAAACTAKDIVLAIIGKIGTAGGTGYAIEFAGSAIRALSMEGRMTVCNMAIEAGARAGMIARRRDDHRLRQGPPVRAARARSGTRRVAYWRTLQSDAGAQLRRRGRRSTPPRSSRRSPGARRPRWWSRSTAACPIPTRKRTPASATRIERALAYMGLEPNTADRPTSASTRCSSARAPTRASRTCAKPPPWCAAGQRRDERQARDGRAGLRAGEGAGRARRPRPRSSRPPASSGASPAARCAWR